MLYESCAHLEAWDTYQYFRIYLEDSFKHFSWKILADVVNYSTDEK